MMGIIEKFLERYSKEYDFYLEAAKLCAQQCEDGLEKNGIRAIVTFRAKRVDRLQDKLEKRNEVKKYKRVEDIYKDIVDLAGVRIAIYFPGDRESVDKFIKSNFDIVKEKRFPEDKKEATYVKRFSGYWANHYRLNMRDEFLSEANKRYVQAPVEIQVASVLMHAWSEVEHDLVYKPLSGNLSEDEYAILDELNGLVLSGEIALERLQKAMKKRISESGKQFNNHYELSLYLYDLVQKIIKDNNVEPEIGRSDILYKFLQQIHMNKSECIDEIISKIKLNIEERPIVDQIIDYLLDGNEKRYEIYNKIKLECANKSPYSTKSEKMSSVGNESSLGFFISRWIIWESMITYIVIRASGASETEAIDKYLPVVGVENKFIHLGLISDDYVYKMHMIRKLKNEVVHGVKSPKDEILIKAGKDIENIIDEVYKNVGDDLKDIVEEAKSKLK